MTFVLDCSATMPWLFEDEFDDRAERLLRRAVAEGIVVPWVWMAEIGNAALTAIKKGRVSEAKAVRFVALLARIPTDYDRPALDAFIRPTIDLAVRFDLSAYDASYLRLAIDRQVPLATKDVKLLKAAASSGVATL